jgi:hypothetical protein
LERAFRFLKSTSVNCGGTGEGVAVAEGDESELGGDESAGDVPAVAALPAGVCSCAVEIEIDEIQANKTQKKPD